MKVKNKKDLFDIHQQEELNSAELYRRIAQDAKSDRERETLLAMSKDEQQHAAVFRKYSNRSLKPNPVRVGLYRLVQRLLGYTFLIKLLERGEIKAVSTYREEIDQIPELRQIIQEEEKHEDLLINLLDEERLHFTGDVILGMNDALVELTGSLAGYTLAMQNSRIIAMAGLITGVSATLSMAGSGYLSSREEDSKNAVKSTVIIGLSYFVTVVLLIIPYLLFPAAAYLWALAATILIALLIIAGFNYYLSVAKDRPFQRGFWSMAAISLGVAVISFAVGFLVKHVLGISL
ncbi:MAG: rubrerythrin family protein [Clostridiales bacterium]|nr:rubrerythrin family protein [Clostridiales bacterium]